MSKRHDEDNLVLVATRGVAALSQPRFIIKVGEKYYATLGLWEYDLEAATTDEQREGCEQIIRWFNESPGPGSDPYARPEPQGAQFARMSGSPGARPGPEHSPEHQSGLFPARKVGDDVPLAWQGTQIHPSPYLLAEFFGDPDHDND